MNGGIPRVDVMNAFLRHLRDAFVSGLLAILPVGGLFYILWFLYHLIDSLVGRQTPFGQMVQDTLGHWIPGMGIYMTLVLIVIVGFITRNFFGRTLQYYIDHLLASVPGIRKMYSTLKQFSNALLNRNSKSFHRVVMFEYPMEGINIIGLVTNENLGKLNDKTKEESILVYAPTAPNPLSGMMLLVPKSRITELDMAVDDALSMILSSGSVLPASLGRSEDSAPRPRFNPFRRRREKE
ncbi:MAG TPA: DUF502 domain-containing protein [Candidatus Acetothermia bacterium]|nr:DUF502 domain-containing protein [Candidatus Acetothermia bacterium]